jgi:hypothetical protein
MRAPGGKTGGVRGNNMDTALGYLFSYFLATFSSSTWTTACRNPWIPATRLSLDGTTTLTAIFPNHRCRFHRHEDEWPGPPLALKRNIRHHHSRRQPPHRTSMPSSRDEKYYDTLFTYSTWLII